MRCGLVGGNVLLGVGFGILNVQARLSVALFLMPADPDVELCYFSSSLSACITCSPT